MAGPSTVKTIEWLGDRVRYVNQAKLPFELSFIETDDVQTLAESIRRLEIRGAPAIGIAAAMGIALAALDSRRRGAVDFRRDVVEAARTLVSTRPTAVNVAWAASRMLGVLDSATPLGPDEAAKLLADEAVAICEEDRNLSRRIGEHGAKLLADGDGVLTHCNAGGLATAEHGTALAVVFRAVEEGRRVRVFAGETRPLLQGARLTTWELLARGIDVTLLTDGAAAAAMSRGVIQKVIVGADRIARNGDVANKVGTFSLALAARWHDIPFYVAAPYSTLDPSLRTGRDITIEERPADEVTTIAGCRIAPAGVRVLNPAFDITPADLVSAIVTDAGVFGPPYEQTLFGGGEGGRRVGRREGAGTQGP